MMAHYHLNSAKLGPRHGEEKLYCLGLNLVIKVQDR